ncbi:GNAT family N-acetyltransferase [Geitlerinema calcuttense]|nr:GNAT family N-acetyltransferase [Geitlerinema calcuttense]
MMKLCRFEDIGEFWQEAQGYLLENEAEHNLLLGISHALLHYPERYPDPAYLAIAKRHNHILGVAIRTAPYKLVLSKVRDLEALRLIAEDLQGDPVQLPGAGGLIPEVEAFREIWQTLTQQTSRRVMDLRIHQLTQVEPVAKVGGYLRLATEGDRPLLLDWFTTFASEIGEIVLQDAEASVTSGLKRQSIYLWEDGKPVSWASGSQSLPKAARIGPVYTPPEYRRKGYATACVAALSQQFLDRGCHSCFLFTDLANPTSNHIYQQIGYRPICDWRDYAFIPKT